MTGRRLSNYSESSDGLIDPEGRQSVGNAVNPETRLVALRHHPSLWVLPSVLLMLALLPLPYGFYTLLRICICLVCGWLAYEQFKHDNAVGVWVVVLGAIAVLYNPILPIHLTREIWSILNVVTALLILAHLGMLRRLGLDPAAVARGRKSVEK